MKPIFRLSIALVTVALVSWLGFVVWSLYSSLPRSGVRLPERVPIEGPATVTPPVLRSRDPEPVEVVVEDLERSGQPNFDGGQSDLSDNGCVRRLPPKGFNLNLGFDYETATTEVLTEKAMAGDGAAQFALGWRLRDELQKSGDDSPYRSEYVSNFLILGIRAGYPLAARDLADLYKAQGRDPVDTAAWLQIFESLSDRRNTRVSARREMEGLGLALSDEEVAESVRRADELTQFYDLPVPRDRPALVSGGGPSAITASECQSEKDDPFLTAATRLEAYRADVVRTSNLPGAVSEAELRQRFRTIRSQFVRSLRLGNGAALSMLAAMHRESSAAEDAVAAAAWEAVGTKLYGTGSDDGSPDSSSSGTRDAIQPSLLADQYIMLFNLD